MKKGFLQSFPAIAVWLFSLIPLAAQQVPSTSGVPARMVVTVEARHGADIPVINREDVMVYQERDRNTVTDWVPAQGDHAALELFILLDDSSTTTVSTQFENIRKFIAEQPASAKIGVAYMQNGSARVQQNLTSDHDQAAKALRLPLAQPGINASPYFSLSDLIKRWPESGARREVLMVSDGIDRYYGTSDLQDPYVSSAIDDAQRAGVIVYAIYNPGAGHEGHSYWLSYWGQIYLSRVADETGGESYYIGFNGSAPNFGPFLDDMTQRLNHQFLLTFLAKPPKKAVLQKVKLTTEINNAELVAADKVFVPAEP